MYRIDILICNLVLAFLLLSLFTACKQAPVQPELQKEPPALDLPEVLNTDVLVPLTVGNWWKYETTRMVSGNKDSSMWRVHADTSLTYEGQTFSAAISGWYYEKDSTVRDTRWLYMNDGSGLNIVGGISSHDTLVTKYVERKYPANVGDAWEFQVLEYDIYQRKFGLYDTLRVICLATDQPFETPAGIFQCHVYYYITPLQGALGKREHFVYYMPGIGMVGWDERSLGEEKFLYKTALYAARVR